MKGVHIMRYFISKNADVVACRQLLRGNWERDMADLTIFTDHAVLDERRSTVISLPTRQIRRSPKGVIVKLHEAQATIAPCLDRRGYELKFEPTLAGTRAEQRLQKQMEPVMARTYLKAVPSGVMSS